MALVQSSKSAFTKVCMCGTRSCSKQKIEIQHWPYYHHCIGCIVQYHLHELETPELEYIKQYLQAHPDEALEI